MTAPTRATLRAQAVTRLAAEVTAVSGRAHASRALPLPGAAVDGGTAALPALLVYADRLVREARADGTYHVTVALTVLVRSEQPTEAALEAELDALSAAVETAILTDPTMLAGLDSILQAEIVRTVEAGGARIAGQDAHQYALRWTEIV